MKKAGEHVRVNFGQSPFIFDIDGMMSASNHDFINFHSLNPPNPSPGPAASPGYLALDGASDTPMVHAPDEPVISDDTPGQDNLPPLSISSAAENQIQLGLQENRGFNSTIIVQEIREAQADLEDLRVRSDETRERASIARVAVDARFVAGEVSPEEIAIERRRNLLELDPSLNNEELAQLLRQDDVPVAPASLVDTVQPQDWIDEACELLYLSLWTRPLHDLSTPDHVQDIRRALRSHLLGHPRIPPLSQELSQPEITALVEDVRNRAMLEIVEAITSRIASPVSISIASPSHGSDDFNLDLVSGRETQEQSESRITGSPVPPAVDGSTGPQEQASSRVAGSPVPQLPANTASTGAQAQANGEGESQRPISTESHFGKTLTDIQLQQEKKHIRQEIEGTRYA
jgi:hypothetical protein